MIIKEKLTAPLNAQIKSEFSAHAQYIAIGVYFADQSLPELSAFFYRQADEEKMHAMMFVNFMLDTGVKPVIPAIDELKNEFSDAADAVDYALKQEMKVTAQIDNLVTIATRENDHTTNQFLQWFVTEQVEEVSSMTDLLNTIKHSGGNLLWVEDYVRRQMAAAAVATPVG
jgi:ferritin